MPDDLSLADPLLPDVPHVLSAVRLHQPMAEVPASVTVLNADFILATGARTIPELLRYVPGMQIAPDIYDNSISVAYHGGPAIFPKSMEVMIDGRSIYRSGLAAVGWDKLPVAVEDIQRIEVVRGPNSTSYGTNAYQGVVNIITRHPSDSGGSSVTVIAGTNAEHDLYAQTTFSQPDHQWRLSGNYQNTDNLEDSTDPAMGCSDGCPDSREHGYLSLRGHHALSASEELDSSLVLSKAHRDLPMYQFSRNEVYDTHIEAGARYIRELGAEHELRISFQGLAYERYQPQEVSGMYSGYFDPLLEQLYRLNPTAARQFANGESVDAIDPSDAQQVSLLTSLYTRYGATPEDFLTPISGELVSGTTEYRGDIEIQDTVALNDSVTLITGAGYRYDRVESANYYNGTVDDHKLRLFSNINWRPSPDWVLHAGAMIEREDGDEHALSLRGAINYLISPVESVRFVYSQAARTPDFLEEDAEWFYRFRSYDTASPYAEDTFYASLLGPGDLPPQKIESLELGYFGRGSGAYIDAEWDIRLFHESLYDVVYLYPSVWSEQVYTNNCVRYQGAEWQLSLSPAEGTTLRLSGAIIDARADTADNDLEEDELVAVFSPFTQSLAWLQRWPAGVHTTTSLFLVQDAGGSSGDETTDMQRLDLHLYQSITLGTLPARWSLRGQYDLSDGPYTPASAGYDDRARVQAGLHIEF